MSLRRLALKANRETGHAHVHDLVTGEEVGAPISRRELEACLEEMSSKGGMVRQASEREHNSIANELIEKFPNPGDNELVAALTEKMESGCDYSTALRDVTKTPEGQRLWDRHTLDEEAGLREFKPEKVALTAQPTELDLAVNRYMTDNSLDYPTALKEFTKTPKGAELWNDYAEGGGE